MGELQYWYHHYMVVSTFHLQCFALFSTALPPQQVVHIGQFFPVVVHDPGIFQQ